MSRTITAVALLAAVFTPMAAHAQTPDEVITTIQQQAGPYAPCEVAVAARETGNTFDPRVVNPSSGTVGLFQFLPSTWENTPLADVPLSVATVSQQIAAASWLLLNFGTAPWAPVPSSCGG